MIGGGCDPSTDANVGVEGYEAGLSDARFQAPPGVCSRTRLAAWRRTVQVWRLRARLYGNIAPTQASNKASG